MHPYNPPEKFDTLAVIRRNKLEFSIACGLGAALPFTAKYIMAGIFIAFMALGGTP